MSMEKPLSAVLLYGVILLGFFGVIAVLLHESVMPFTDKAFSMHTVYANQNIAIHVIVADTKKERQIGLGNKAVLAAREGMLFKFDTDGKWRIWMKDMNFGIDILWLSEDGTIVYMRERVYPDTYPFVFEPDVAARYVLEVTAGFSEANGIRKGGKIDLNF